MATQTTHYNLKKPDLSDLVKVSDLNDNFDTIDEKIYEAMQSGGSATGMIEQAVESSATSAHAYAVGEHFIYNDSLYRATAAIAVGDTITPGTNCAAVTVTEELEGKKNVQTAVSDPTADGSGLSFIDSISQDAQGVITPHKKNVQTDASPTDSSTNPVQSGGVYTALAGKIPTTEKGAANGVAELDATGRVPSSQLPSYVDDVIEGYYYNGGFYEDAAHTTPITGEDGKIYVDMDTNKTYRWSGTAFVVIASDLALGETSSTAYRGDRGKAAYDHSLLTSGNPHNVTKSDVGLGNADNTSDADKPISTATQAALDLKAADADVQAGTEAKKAYHMGFYLDSDGDLCQA